SEAGKQVSAEFAEVIFSAPLTLDAAKATYADLKGRMVQFGRDPDHMKILPGLSTVVGHSETDAAERHEYMQSLIHPVVAREILSTVLGGVDLTGYSLDDPLPTDLPRSNASQSTFQYVTEMARRENLTIRQIALRVAGARGKSVVRGSPQQIADLMEEWFVNEACDGFNIMPPYLPGALDDFVELVIPELQRRGLFRTEYEGRTLRENLGLPRPESRYRRAAAGQRARATEAVG
ncbi:MAG: nitrilotriacetate monooxygenase, partial [Xanthobacteraceae bacterium]